MIYATSDIHGYPMDLFQDLLRKAGLGSSDHLYVIGDVIDRNGDGGVAMLRWMMRQPNVTLLRENHEAMMCKYCSSDMPIRCIITSCLSLEKRKNDFSELALSD